MAGIKQGLPLSPWLFLFYINDIFDFFNGIYGQQSILESLHILIHADDTTLIASCRETAEKKLNSLMFYCNLNKINLQLTKCEFIVINGNASDKRDFLLKNGKIKNKDHISLLGSQISQTGKIKSDMELHMQKRHYSIHKFYNFLRANKLAPIPVKLKVLRSCVMAALLHNCECFGDNIPDNLESQYYKLIKCCLGVRSNTPNKLVLLESGLPPIKALILTRQYNFIQRFEKYLEPDSPRHIVYQQLLTDSSNYIRHYKTLQQTYISKQQIYQTFNLELKNEIQNCSDRSKFALYMKFNPTLIAPDMIQHHWYYFTKLRLSSHRMPIETGRWSRTHREQRVCNSCNTIGDEEHYIYHCIEINRTNISNIPPLNQLDQYEKLPLLLKNLKTYL